MPLLDHFHPPLQNHRHWEGFHGWWAATIASLLNDHLLPPEYFAEYQITVSTRIEVAVAPFTEEEAPRGTSSQRCRHGGPGADLGTAHAGCRVSCHFLRRLRGQGLSGRGRSYSGRGHRTR